MFEEILVFRIVDILSQLSKVLLFSGHRYLGLNIIATLGRVSRLSMEEYIIHREHIGPPRVM